MIAADKQELQSRLKQVTLQIREKEISVFTDNFAVLSTQSAFLTGLGFGGLTMVPTWDTDKKTEEIIFYILVSVSIGFNILTLCISSWCMIFGPGLAIRGPDGSMSRAVEGMYAERKWALRFFWTGLFFIMLSGISLGWLKFHWKTATTMTVIFVAFIVTFFVYVKYVTRPRFRFPKDAKRKPGEFRVAGYDPETGQFNGAAIVDIDPLLKAIQEVESLKARGFLSDEEATAKITQIQQRVEAAAALAGKPTSLRNRLFGSNGSGGNTNSTLASHTSATRIAGGAANDTASIGYSMHSTGGGNGASASGSGAGSQGSGGSGGGGMSATSNDLIAGMLVRDGKLLKYALSHSGSLTQATMQGTVEKQWPVSGDPLVTCSEDTSKPNHFTLTVGGGKTKLKLRASNEAEMNRWLDAIRKTASAP